MEVDGECRWSHGNSTLGVVVDGSEETVLMCEEMGLGSEVRYGSHSSDGELVGKWDGDHGIRGLSRWCVEADIVDVSGVGSAPSSCGKCGEWWVVL
jgi:hypothetical protein